MIHLFYLMAIGCPYVARICTCCTTANMNLASPDCLTLHLKNSYSALTVFFSPQEQISCELHAQQSRCPSHKGKEMQEILFLPIEHFSFTVCFCFTLQSPVSSIKIRN